MDLFILRHGIAVERGTPGYERDFDRPLTPEGEKKLRSIAKAMGKLEVTFDAVLSSPLVRARQTAEVVLRELGRANGTAAASDNAGLRLTDALGPEAKPHEVVAELQRLKPQPGSALLVGHEPYLSTLITVLISGSEEPCVTMKKGGLCKLTVEALRVGRCATLDWLLTPKQLQRMD